MTKQAEFKKALENNDKKNISSLLLDPSVDPSADNNYAIHSSNLHGYTKIVNLLWKNKKVKNTLKYDNLELYNKLIKLEIKNKLSHF